VLETRCNPKEVRVKEGHPINCVLRRRASGLGWNGLVRDRRQPPPKTTKKKRGKDLRGVSVRAGIRNSSSDRAGGSDFPDMVAGTNGCSSHTAITIALYAYNRTTYRAYTSLRLRHTERLGNRTAAPGAQQSPPYQERSELTI
jgi:hypothetical protein